MPNHVANIIKFNNVSDDVPSEVKIFDESVVAFKLSLLILNEPNNSEYIGYLDHSISDKDIVLKIINDFDLKISDEFMVGVLMKYSKDLPEVFRFSDFYGNNYFNEDGTINLEKLKEKIKDSSWDHLKSVGFFYTDAWRPMKLLYAVAGFNNTFIRSGIVKDFNLYGLSFLSGYDASVNYYGTKWGIYNTSYENGVLYYETAWSPLNDESLIALVNYVKEKTGMIAYEHIYAEQGIGFCGNNIFLVENGSLEFNIRREDEFSLFYSDGDCYFNIENSEMPEYLREMENYSFGG
jgi:hypothetical protein